MHFLPGEMKAAQKDFDTFRLIAYISNFHANHIIFHIGRLLKPLTIYPAHLCTQETNTNAAVVGGAGVCILYSVVAAAAL